MIKMTILKENLLLFISMFPQQVREYNRFPLKGFREKDYALYHPKLNAFSISLKSEYVPRNPFPKRKLDTKCTSFLPYLEPPRSQCERPCVEGVHLARVTHVKIS